MTDQQAMIDGTTYWMVWHPEGWYLTYTANFGEVGAIDNFTENGLPHGKLVTWEDAEAAGYRCIRVKIVPAKDSE